VWEDGKQRGVGLFICVKDNRHGRLVNSAAEGSMPLQMEITMTGIGRTVKSAVGESLHVAMVIAMTESGTMVISAVEGSKRQSLRWGVETWSRASDLFQW
jgi:hypothetical protein